MEKHKKLWEDYKKPIKYLFIGVLLMVSFFAIRSELKNIKIDDLRQIASSLARGQLFLFFLAGFIAFAFQIPYDVILSKRYEVQMKLSELFEISWICHSFNNFIGIAGITGVALRSNLYENANVERGKALKIAIITSFSSMVGLFFLGFPSMIALYKNNQLKFIPPLFLMFLLGLLYLFIDKLPLSFLKDKEWVKELSFPLRIEITIASLLEWLVSALYFAYAVKLFQPDISILECTLVYVIATILGLISMIPGSLGSFDGAVLVLMGTMDFADASTLLSLLLFRLGYVFIPWVFGIILLAIRNYKNEKGIMNDPAYHQLLRRIMGTAVLFSGILLGLSAATPEIFTRIHILHRFFPNIVPIISSWITFGFAILLIVLSRGIFSGVRKAYYGSLVVLTLAAAASIFKGLDFEESIIMLIIAGGLVIGQRAFQHPSIPLNFKNLWKVCLAVLAALMLFGWIFRFSVWKGHYQRLKLMNIHFLWDHLGILITGLLFAIAIGLFLTFSTRKYLEVRENTKEEKEIFENIINQYPNSAYTQLFYMDDKNVYFNKNRKVAILYGTYKEHILALGDPVGEEEEIENAIDEMVLWAEDHNMILSFYEITGKYLEHFINNGFQLMKLGENALVDLENFKTTGKHAKSFRQALNNMDEAGLLFKVYEPPFSKEFIGKLKEISDSWLQGRKEMGYSIGSFYEYYLQRNALFTIETKTGEIKSFANLLELKNTDTFSIDLMRYSETEISGIMEMLLISIIQWGKEKGYRFFDLGISPLSNVGNKPYSGSKEKVIFLAYKYGSRIYGFIGLRNFKQKFHPQWKNVYIAYKENRLLPEILFDLSLLCHKGKEE